MKNRLLIAFAFVFGIATFAVSNPAQKTVFHPVTSSLMPIPICNPGATCTN
jgi:hypothetical protein